MRSREKQETTSASSNLGESVIIHGWPNSIAELHLRQIPLFSIRDKAQEGLIFHGLIFHGQRMVVPHSLRVLIKNFFCVFYLFLYATTRKTNINRLF